MDADAAGRAGHEAKALWRFAAGSTIGLAAGVTGLALPIALILLASYSPGTIYLTGAQLVEATAILALAGALLFALSLWVYRLGFSMLQRSDKRFYVASVLAWIGTVGVLLVVVAIGIAFLSSGTMSGCIQAAPANSLACLHAAAPLASYSGVLGFWLVWLGGLGVVFGIGLAGTRYHQLWFYGGAGVYSLLLLGLIAPALSLVFPIDPPAFLLLATPLLAAFGPAAIFHGARRSVGGHWTPTPTESRPAQG
jgi:hypothetical protein